MVAVQVYKPYFLVFIPLLTLTPTEQMHFSSIVSHWIVNSMKHCAHPTFTYDALNKMIKPG